MMLQWERDKDPDEVVDYQVSWDQQLGDDDTIDEVTVTVSEDSEVVVDSSTADGSDVTIWFSGGAEGENCDVLVAIDTAAGRHLEQTITLRVRSR